MLAALSPTVSAPAERSSLEVLNPLEHPDWDALLADHPDATFFHTAAWARVLAETYSHLPLYFCRFVNGQLGTLLPVMEVSSPMTGRRGVSLPFTDFCPPLARDPATLSELYEQAMQWGRAGRWRYLECRGGVSSSSSETTGLQDNGTAGLQTNLKAESRKQKAEMEDGRRRTEDGGRKTEDETTGLRTTGLQDSELRTPNSELRTTANASPFTTHPSRPNTPALQHSNTPFPGLPNSPTPSFHHSNSAPLPNSEPRTPNSEPRSPLPALRSDAPPSLAFHGHVIDLAGGPDALFKQLDSSTRRGIRKAQDAHLQIEFSNRPEALREYYTLHCRTRHRHGLPPQPPRFFDNLARHALAPGHGFVVTARHERRLVAAAVFCHFGRQAIYKFGASDFACQHLRPNNLVMWEAIKRLATEGFAALHLGRTSLANEGLRRFKLGFGAREHQISYSKYDFIEGCYVTDTDRAEGWHNRVFRLLPPPLLRLAGRVLYPHLS